MVKKLHCDSYNADWVRVDPSESVETVAIHVCVGLDENYIFLTPSDAKKLRKQIKKALAEIEVEPEDVAADEDEEPAYIPHVGEVVEVYRNTQDHGFPIGERVRVTYIAERGGVKAEFLDGRDFWWVEGDILPIRNWEPKEGEKVLIVADTFSELPGSKAFVGQTGTVRAIGYVTVHVWSEDKSDWFGFNFSDLRPAE